MRSIWPGLSALFLLPALALAQQPTGPNQAQMLNYVLGNWEQSMGKLQSFSVTCNRTTQDKTFGGVEVYEGTGKFLKSAQGQPSRAHLKLTNKKDPSKYEEFLYTGTFLYEYVPARKVLRVHDAQPKPGQAAMDDNVVALLTGMTAAAAQTRYQITWVPDTKDSNKFYHYLQILPRTPQDKADFTECRLVLTAKDFLPRQIWILEPNGNQRTWDFEKVDVNVQIPPQTFAPPQLPGGWTMERPPPTGPAGVPPKK